MPLSSFTKEVEKWEAEKRRIKARVRTQQLLEVHQEALDKEIKLMQEKK